MPKPFPPEVRRGVVAVARKSDAPIAKDVGNSASRLQRWSQRAAAFTPGTSPKKVPLVRGLSD